MITVPYRLCDWCCVQLLLSLHPFCGNHTSSCLECCFFETTCVRCVCVSLYCPPGRMTRIFYTLPRQRVGGTETEIRASTDTWPRRRKDSCWDSNPKPIDLASGDLPPSCLRYIQLPPTAVLLTSLHLPGTLVGFASPSLLPPPPPQSLHTWNGVCGEMGITFLFWFEFLACNLKAFVSSWYDLYAKLGVSTE